MKELSIEEKAKAYDVSLERARKIHKYSSDLAEIKRMEYIFPELAESEDEKKKKRIIQAIKIREKEMNEEWSDEIAWLEKQGNPNTEYWKGYKDGKKAILDKYSETCKVVEPKFKVGDWVVDNCDYVWKIEGILNQFYILECVEGGESRPTIEWVDKTFHLWTIQDAKPGDVLADDYGIYIFDRFDEHDERCFLCMGVYQYSQKVFENEHMLCSVEVYPATKEQRDLLFQKMKESGYEWDANNKELNKIHIIDEGKAEMDHCFTKMMNSENVSSIWSEEDEKNISTIRIALRDAKLDAPEEFESYGRETTVKDFENAESWLKSIKERIGG